MDCERGFADAFGSGRFGGWVYEAEGGDVGIGGGDGVGVATCEAGYELFAEVWLRWTCR